MAKYIPKNMLGCTWIHNDTWNDFPSTSTTSNFCPQQAISQVTLPSEVILHEGKRGQDLWLPSSFESISLRKINTMVISSVQILGPPTKKYMCMIFYDSNVSPCYPLPSAVIIELIPTMWVAPPLHSHELSTRVFDVLLFSKQNKTSTNNSMNLPRITNNSTSDSQDLSLFWASAVIMGPETAPPRLLLDWPPPSSSPWASILSIFSGYVNLYLHLKSRRYS